MRAAQPRRSSAGSSDWAARCVTESEKIAIALSSAVLILTPLNIAFGAFTIVPGRCWPVLISPGSGTSGSARVPHRAWTPAEPAGFHCGGKETIPMKETENLMEKLTSLCKRRGFIFPSSEIYGGLNGFWDYGPLGAELKKNIKENWWKSMVHDRDDVVGIDSSIVTHPRVWEASGHVDSFADPMVDCKGECRQ